MIDTMLMGNSSVQEDKILKNSLNSFLLASGLDINKEKSQIYFFNTCQITKRNILYILEFTEGSPPAKYLGAPLTHSISRKISWKDLLNSLNKKLNCGTHISLNLPSRLTLVKVVLQTMPLYLLSTMAAPKSILKKLRELQRTFLCGGTENHKKWSLVNWNTLCTPKIDGGLSLRDPNISNQISNANIWWKWITHTTEPWALL